MFSALPPDKDAFGGAEVIAVADPRNETPPIRDSTLHDPYFELGSG
jgi:hypothetical protein